MFNKAKLFIQLFKNMGLRYTIYRLWHIVDQKAGLLKKRHPINPASKSHISKEQWQQQTPKFIIDDRQTLTDAKNPTPLLQNKAERIFAGEIQFFNYEWKQLGLDYNWFKNPDTGYIYPHTHWSQIQDFNPANGDIKYVWEKSRFSWLLTILRYDYHFEKDSSKFVFDQIENWIDNNPINIGPNWKCSQEISLRTFNWLYAVYFYKNSSHLTEKLWQKIQHTIYWQLHHVYHHINFSRIAVRNNHAITETLCLALSEIIFPYIPDAKKWSKDGRKWFEQEIEYQIYEDGAFIQHSMNYHRVLIQLLSFGFKISEVSNKHFSKNVYHKAYKTLDFLYQFVQTQNGHLPNYGSNDGALFFPLSDTDYRDYRPQLNTLHKILTGKDIFEIKEDFLLNTQPKNTFEKLTLKEGIVNFESSGYYIFRKNDIFTFIRCASFKDRPAQADNLHLDVWLNGQNIIRDGGSYKYNDQNNLSEYFFGTQSHNTVSLNNEHQMQKGSRFIWYYWTKALSASTKIEGTAYTFKGKISAFKHLGDNIFHEREVNINENQMTITDQMINSKNLIAKQLWHLSPNNTVEIEAIENLVTLQPEIIDSYFSSYYGQKEEQKGYGFSFKNKIITKISLPK